MGKTSVFLVIRKRDPFLFWLGHLVSSIGDNFEYIALLALSYKLSGSTLVMGSVMVAFIVPSVVVGLFSGVLVDRWDLKKTMVWSDILRAIFVLVPPVLMFTGAIQLWHLYLYAVAFGSVSPFFEAANQAMLPSLVQKEEYMALNSLMQSSINISLIVGLGLGGLAISLVGIEGAYIIDSLTFLFSALTVYLLRTNPQKLHEKEVLAEKFLAQFWRDFLSGIRFYVKDRPVLWLFISSVINSFVDSPIGILLLPLAQTNLGVGFEVFGFLGGMFGLGTLLGAVFMGFPLRIKNRVVWMSLFMALSAVFLGALALSKSILVSFLAIFLTGFTIMPSNIIGATIYQERVPVELRARVFGAKTLVMRAVAPIGIAAAGAVSDATSVGTTFFLISAVMFAVGVLLVFAPGIMALSKPHDGPQEVALPEQS